MIIHSLNSGVLKALNKSTKLKNIIKLNLYAINLTNLIQISEGAMQKSYFLKDIN